MSVKQTAVPRDRKRNAFWWLGGFAAWMAAWIAVAALRGDGTAALYVTALAATLLICGLELVRRGRW